MSISVVICTKNRPTEVIRCLDSIAAQTLLPQEIVIVDASDTFELTKRLDTWSGRDKFKVSYIHSEPGLTLQRNIGARASSGDVVFFIDDDIVLENEYVAEICKIFENDPAQQVGGVMGDIYENAEERKRIGRWQRFVRSLFFLDDYGNGKFRLSGRHTIPLGLDKIQPTEYLSGGQVAYRRRVLDELTFDENLEGYGLMEDDDFSYRVSRRYRNVYTPFAKCRHLHSSTERLSRREFKKMALNHHTYLFRKNVPKTLPHRFAFWLSILGLSAKPLLERPVRFLIAKCVRVLLGPELSSVLKDRLMKADRTEP
jgi:GT2 family glycosyltransferase